jgi:hypothetical protein
MHKTAQEKLAVAVLAEAYYGEWDQMAHHPARRSERGKGL